jgi:hypothetical protein
VRGTISLACLDFLHVICTFSTGSPPSSIIRMSYLTLIVMDRRMGGLLSAST